jgi:Fe-S cluster assembly protein SufD
MTAEVRSARTSAEQAIADHFRTALPALPGGARVRRVREEAFALFGRFGLPTRRIEEWKYTDLRALMRKAATPAQRPTAEAAARALKETADPLAGLDRLKLVLVDGYFFPELSDVAALADAGIVPASLAALLKADDEISERLFTRTEPGRPTWRWLSTWRSQRMASPFASHPAQRWDGRWRSCTSRRRARASRATRSTSARARACV